MKFTIMNNNTYRLKINYDITSKVFEVLNVSEATLMFILKDIKSYLLIREVDYSISYKKEIAKNRNYKLFYKNKPYDSIKNIVASLKLPKVTFHTHLNKDQELQFKLFLLKERNLI